MKKILLTLFSLFAFQFLLFNPASAELKLDIIAGNTEPIPVAVQEFELDQSSLRKEATALREVIVNDLQSTGLFRMINKDAFPEKVKMDKLPSFADWTAIKAQVLVQTKMTAVADGKYKLEFFVWDIPGKEQIEAQNLVSSKKSARRLAHILADAVYERLTGEIGYFDTQIIFITETGEMTNRTKKLAIMDSDGFNLKYISNGADMVMSPKFSPNMQTVVFLSYRDDDPMVWALDLDSGTQHKLGKFNGMTFAPAYSPDGVKIALSLSQNGATNLYEFNTETKNLTQLTSGDVIDTSPSYSPDGKTIAFNSNRSGSQQIHTLNIATGEIKRLSFGNGRYATPAWSPDGNFIAFTKISSDTFYIGIMNPRGKNEKILASGWFMENPSWAPGSRRVVYYETEKDTAKDWSSHIRSVDINGMNDYEIKLPNGVSGTLPTWSPRLP